MTGSRLDAPPLADLRADPARALLRHLMATLAYRASKAMRDAPPDFGEFAAAPSARHPAQIVAHMGDLMDWALHLARGEWTWHAAGSGGWEANVQRFFRGLEALDAYVASGASLGLPAEVIIQGPLADALTHVGQLAMLRGLAGAPIRPESYGRAVIVAGRVGIEQAPPRREFDGDASAPSH